MKCPGQDSRYWKPGAVFEAKCPKCGAEVEFFKDESSRRCKACGHVFVNPQMDFGCASYCKYAEQCLGSMSPDLLAHRADLLKDRVAIEMKRHYRQDFRRIGHASRAARYAEKIGKLEGGSLPVILIAAYLYDVIPEDRSPETARDILVRLGARDDLVKEVARILSLKGGSREDLSLEGKIVQDAERIAALEERAKEDPSFSRELESYIPGAFLTPSGGGLAREVLRPFLQNNP
jgi:hypothetical protein